jgi:transposase
MNVRYRVELSQDERDELTALLSGGKHAARKLKRAQILLAADAGISDDDIAVSIAVGGSTVYRTKRRFVEGNLEAALSEEPRPGAERKLSGQEEALLVATACSDPPEGRARWTLELLAGAMVALTEQFYADRWQLYRRDRGGGQGLPAGQRADRRWGCRPRHLGRTARRSGDTGAFPREQRGIGICTAKGPQGLCRAKPGSRSRSHRRIVRAAHRGRR